MRLTGYANGFASKLIPRKAKDLLSILRGVRDQQAVEKRLPIRRGSDK
jgi:hypothetical protein